MQVGINLWLQGHKGNLRVKIPDSVNLSGLDVERDAWM